MEADRILCLNEGRVIEFDTPLNLLNNPEGFFYQLVDHSGPEAANKLKQIALQHARPNNAESILENQPPPDSPTSHSSSTTAIEHKKTVGTSTSATIIPPASPTDSHNHKNNHIPPSLGDVFVQPSSSTSTPGRATRPSIWSACQHRNGSPGTLNTG